MRRRSRRPRGSRNSWTRSTCRSASPSAPFGETLGMRSSARHRRRRMCWRIMTAGASSTSSSPSSARWGRRSYPFCFSFFIFRFRFRFHFCFCVHFHFHVVFIRVLVVVVVVTFDVVYIIVAVVVFGGDFEFVVAADVDVIVPLECGTRRCCGVYVRAVAIIACVKCVSTASSLHFCVHASNLVETPLARLKTTGRRARGTSAEGRTG